MGFYFPSSRACSHFSFFLGFVHLNFNLILIWKEGEKEMFDRWRRRQMIFAKVFPEIEIS